MKMNLDSHPLFDSTLDLLLAMTGIPSFSREEETVSTFIEKWLNHRNVKTLRHYNNIVGLPDSFDSSKPILLLNSHIDTVKPATNYTRDPFKPEIVDGKVYGLGTNDAGASVVSLANVFVHMKSASLPVNIVLALSAEEEVSGEHGMRSLLPYLGENGLTPDMAIVGEPTGMAPALAERGLVVLDAEVRGVSAHAANGNGINAIYRAIDDINRLRLFVPERKSEVLGDIGINVTVIEAGRQHNVVPDICRYVVDVRTTDAYTNEETVGLLQKETQWSSLVPRSTRLQASAIARSHPLVTAAMALGREPFVSPTISDRALMKGIPALKIGPGDSRRSHSADEYVLLDEIVEGITGYEKLLKNLTIE